MTVGVRHGAKRDWSGRVAGFDLKSNDRAIFCPDASEGEQGGA